MIEERRKFLRFDIHIQGELKLEGGNKLSSMSVVNFSRGGLKILTTGQNLFKDNVVNLKICLPNKTKLILARGKVMWLKAFGGESEIGIKLEQMDRVDKSKVLDYAYKIWHKALRSGIKR